MRTLKEVYKDILKVQKDHEATIESINSMGEPSDYDLLALQKLEELLKSLNVEYSSILRGE